MFGEEENTKTILGKRASAFFSPESKSSLSEVKAGRPALVRVSIWRVKAKASNLEVMVLLGCGLRFGMQLL